MDLSSLLVLMDPQLIILIFLGVFFGMYIGAIPGLTGTMAASLLISFTYTWDVMPALAVMLGVHVGCCYGGSRGAILLNIPGAPGAIATGLEGYPLAKKGLAARAISITATHSVFGGLVGAAFLLLACKYVSKFALMFQSRDYVLLALMGLTLIGSLGGNSFVKSLLCGAFGLLLGTIGMDVFDGVKRFIFGYTYLYQGINYIAVMIGLFGFSEALIQVRDINIEMKVKQKVDKIRPHFRDDILKYLWLSFRCAVIGTFVGALPGTGGDIAALISYDHAKRTVKKPKVPFGEGAIEGLVAPESANNAAVGGAYIPMLAFGIPGDSYAAIVIGAMTIHGLTPGPTLMNRNPEIVAIISGGLLLANIFLLPVGLSGVKIFAKIIEIPKQYLVPVIISLCTIGAYAINRSMLDVYVMILFGVLGYYMKSHDYPVGCTVLGLILCDLIEENFRRSLILGGNTLVGMFATLFESVLSIVLLTIVVLLFVAQIPAVKNRKKH